MMNHYKLVAPDVDRLLSCFESGLRNPSVPSSDVASAMNPLFAKLADLAPLSKNNEVKSIWLQIPRGSIEDYDSFDDLVAYGEVKTRKEYEARWQDDYPEEVKWYELVLVESFNKDGSLRFRAVSLDNKTIICAELDRDEAPSPSYTDDYAIALCTLLTEAVAEPLRKLRDGTYNDEVEGNLPYWFRTGVIRRDSLWAVDPRWKENSLDGLKPESINAFQNLLSSGVNDEQRIGRITTFTANDFFRACAIGYEALGYKTEGFSLSELYLHYADGRDEGLTGTGYGLNEGPGIDFDDPTAWDSWYFGNRGGGHPWEVVRGGNSTHVDLFVRHDRRHLEWKLRFGEISEDEYEKRIERAGYYFEIRGKHRPLEAVTFYLVLSDAGLPVVLADAEEILARFLGTDLIGIVPHHVSPRYCESLFPDKYGRIIDFMHVYDEDIESLKPFIEWIPEEPASLSDRTSDD